MVFSANMRRMLLPLAVIVVIVSIAVPLCVAHTCEMPAGMMSGMHQGMGLTLRPVCAGYSASSLSVPGVVPPGVMNLLLTLVAAIAAVVALGAPRSSSMLAPVRIRTSPPPPDDPRGMRTLI